MHNHERQIAHVEEATLVMSRLQSDMARTMAELREAAELHTRRLLHQENWPAEFDAKLDRLEALITKGHGGNGQPPATNHQPPFTLPDPPY